MAKIKFELNRSGVSELLKGEAMQSVIKDHASRTASACGAGYKSDVFVGKNRANASVFTESDRAKLDNLKNNTILKNLK